MWFIFILPNDTLMPPVKTPPGQQSKMSSTSQIKIISAAIFSWCFCSLKNIPSLFYLLFNPYAGNESILNFKVVQTLFFSFPPAPKATPAILSINPLSPLTFSHLYNLETEKQIWSEALENPTTVLCIRL